MTVVGSVSVTNTFEVGSGNAVLFVSDDKVGINTETPNKELTVVGSVSSNDLIYAGIGNSNLWNSAYVTTNNLSSNWSYQGTDIKSLTGFWDSTYTTVNSNSSTNWSYQGTDIKALTGFWDSTYTTVNSNSSTNWSYQGTDIKSLSSNWQSTYTTVSSTSSIWNFTTTNVQSNSANWQTAYGYVSANSINLTATNIFINNTLTVTNTVSAQYYQGTLLDWMTLVRGYKTIPTLLESITNGDVYTYVYSTTGPDKTYYRFIATDGSEDAFYGNFSSPTLSNLIAKKSIIL